MIKRFNYSAKFDGIEDEIVIEQNWDEQGVSAVVWEAVWYFFPFFHPSYRKLDEMYYICAKFSRKKN